jgi:5'-deoxynucleotidase YfbR-like HD superfamily hydrolase
MNNWIQTYSGLQFDYEDLNLDGISIIDIAHALSNVPRYSGHVKFPYSVAQHSIIVSSLFGHKELAFQALMHDAAEAYLGDLPTPAKRLVPEYQELEDNVLRAIFKKYRIPYPIYESVHFADKQVLLAERYKLFDKVIPWAYYQDIRPAKVAIIRMRQEAVEHQFKQRFLDLVSVRD